MRAVIEASIAMGQVVCISDPVQAARRDAAYLAGDVPPLPPFPGLSGGLICTHQPFSCDTPAGLLSVHGQIRTGDARRVTTMRCRMAFTSSHSTPIRLSISTPLRRLRCERIGGRAIGMTTDAAKAVAGRVLLDVSGKYQRFFDEHGVKAIIVRPDYYIFGAVKDLADLPALLGDLTSRLGADLDTLTANARSGEQALA